MRKVNLAPALLVALLFCADHAFAQAVTQTAAQLCFFGFCIGGGGGHNPAPAPLLAAGIPAFTALGGGLLVSRIYRRLRNRS